MKWQIPWHTGRKPEEGLAQADDLFSKRPELIPLGWGEMAWLYSFGAALLGYVVLRFEEVTAPSPELVPQGLGNIARSELFLAVYLLTVLLIPIAQYFFHRKQPSSGWNKAIEAAGVATALYSGYAVLRSLLASEPLVIVAAELLFDSSSWFLMAAALLIYFRK